MFFSFAINFKKKNVRASRMIIKYKLQSLYCPHKQFITKGKNKRQPHKIEHSVKIVCYRNRYVLTELQEVELGIKDMEQQILTTQEQLSRVDITAPISGVVHEQAIFTIGGVIGPGAPVLQIIPEGQNMEFEVNVEPQNIDQIFEGQEVSVMFSAFNMRTTPQLNGTVKSVSLNTSVDEASGFAFYPVRISFPEEELARLDGKALVSGMPIEAFFTTDSRSPMNYLIKPLTDNVKRALREE